MYLGLAIFSHYGGFYCVLIGNSRHTSLYQPPITNSPFLQIFSLFFHKCLTPLPPQPTNPSSASFENQFYIVGLWKGNSVFFHYQVFSGFDVGVMIFESWDLGLWYEIFLKSYSLGRGKFKVVEEKCGEKKSDLSMVMMVFDFCSIRKSVERKKFLCSIKVVFSKYLGLLDILHVCWNSWMSLGRGSSSIEL